MLNAVGLNFAQNPSLSGFDDLEWFVNAFYQTIMNLLNSVGIILIVIAIVIGITGWKIIKSKSS